MDVLPATEPAGLPLSTERLWPGQVKQPGQQQQHPASSGHEFPSFVISRLRQSTDTLEDEQ